MVAPVASPARSRLLRALTAGLLVLFGLGTALAATGPGEAEPTLTVPAVRAGDRGDYVAALEHKDGTPAGVRAGHWTDLRFLWHDGRLRTDVEGRPHQVHVLETYTEATPGAEWTTSWAEWSVDATTAQTILVDERWASSGSTTTVGNSTTSGQWTTFSNSTTFADGAALCGLRSSLHGQTQRVGQNILVAGGCGAEAGLGDSGLWEFRYDGRELVDGRLAYRYAPADGGLVRVWYTAGLGAPVQVLQPAVADDEVRDVNVRLRLVAWEAGPVPETMPELPPTGPLAPPLEYRPRDRLTGPALGGDHPFPHDTAWWAAMQDSRSGLSAFFAARPESYLMTASGFVATNGATEAFTWNFVVTDGLAGHGVSVTQYRVAAGDALGLPSAPVRLDIRTFPVNQMPSWLPDPDQVPDVPVPTFASLAARWSFLTGRQAAMPAYGFGFGCASYGCDEVVSWSFAGRASTDFEVSASAEVWDVLLHDQDRVLWLLQEDSQTVAQLGVGGFRPLPPLAPARATPQPPSAAAALASTWLWSPVGAGTFVAALAVAVVTYLWPTLKHAAVGLFSRLTPDAIASHPTRQAILEALQAEPGLHFQALCRRLGKGRGVVGHHVAKLAADGKVVAHRRGGFVCYFLAGQGTSAGTVAQVTALKAEGAQRLLEEVRRHPGLSGLELASTTGMAPSTVHYHAKRLQDAGLVVSTPRGRSLTLKATPTGERAATMAAAGGA